MDTRTFASTRAGSPGALTSLLLSMLMASLATSLASVALPSLAQAFHAPFQSTQWILLAYLLAVTSLSVGVGRLGDVFGRKRVLLVGIGVFTFASILCGVALNLSMLVAARALQGLGAACMMTLAIALVGETTSKEKTGAAMGLLGATSAIGTALGPSIGGLLLTAFDWRVLFLMNAPLGVAAVALAWRFLPVDQGATQPQRSRFDISGTLLLALTLAAFSLAATVGGGRFGSVNIAFLCAAMLGLGAFAAVEARAASPLIGTSVLRDRRLIMGLCSNAIVSAVLMTTLLVGPFYLARALGLGPLIVGLAMSAGPVVAALAGAPAGRLVDRLGAGPTSIAGLIGVTLGCTLLAIMPSSWGLAGYLAPIAVLTASYALFQAANSTMLVIRAEPTDRGLISGLLNLTRNLGLMTGASAMGAVFAMASNSIEPPGPHAVAVGMRATFLFAAALAGLATAMAATNRR